jgi:hypothetical protein
MGKRVAISLKGFSKVVMLSFNVRGCGYSSQSRYESLEYIRFMRKVVVGLGMELFINVSVFKKTLMG